MLRYLVSSSAIGYTNRVFAVVAVLKKVLFSVTLLIYRLYKALAVEYNKAVSLIHPYCNSLTVLHRLRCVRVQRQSVRADTARLRYAA